jgi:two-component SAPR family response regulator
MGFDASQSHSIVEHLERDAIAANAFSASINDILEIATTHETVSMLVVNGDAFGELPNTVDALRSVREIQPHMSIVLVSSKVANDDLSDERKAICDATLRAPITMARLDVTIRATLVDRIEHCSNTSRDVAYSGCVIPMFQS